ncbi:MAG TPA: hypothetical protein VGC17_01390 [Lactovum miscens]|uniref:hypothetical protein n=1 Tax=Lactovum miscens TaxID=190387 RepID=UPI002EDA0799
MKVSLNGLGIFMIVLGVLVIVLGSSYPGFWIYSLILIIVGLGWMFKAFTSRNDNDKKNKNKR